MPPKTILNAPTKLMKQIGYGESYRYDHDEPDAFSGQDYWPEKLGRQDFYEPVDRGFEREIRKRLDWWERLRRERRARTTGIDHDMPTSSSSSAPASAALCAMAVNVGCARYCGTAFPWGTLTVNVVGSFLMGVLAGWLAFKAGEGWSQPLRLFLTTGILGGFTTFSAFSLDAVLIWERGQGGLAAAYVAASVLLSIAGLVDRSRR